MSLNWIAVAARLDAQAEMLHWGRDLTPTDGQRDAVPAIADRVRRGQRSLLLADEVGMGKTLIAAALVKAVQAEGGRSAIVIPPGIGGQWQSELRRLDPADSTLLPLRSYRTFLDAFQRPEDTTDRETIRKKHRKKLADRRQQRELPAQGWSAEPILLLSHNLGNIRASSGATAPYAMLITALKSVAQGKRRYRHNPREGLHQNVARATAEHIRENLSDAHFNELMMKVSAPTLSPKDQARVVVASGLGRFDLVVIDEAHKARGMHSALSRVLSDMTWKSEDVFRLGMTATPVELDSEQWVQTLERLGLPHGVAETLRPAISDYVKMVEALRSSIALTPASVGKYQEVSKIFHEHLADWVLRRDQRDDPFIQHFHDKHGSHRVRNPIEVSLTDMPLAWKRAYLASEAMSLLAEHDLTPAERRLRLSLPDGRRLDSGAAPDELSTSPRTPGQKAWSDLAQEVTRDGGDMIFSHPAITQTVREIEALVANGQKVLVFGRFTEPMRALTLLLDAREMVRRLCAEEGPNTRWPESTLPKNPKRERALEAALADRSINTASLDKVSLLQRMQERAGRQESARRANLLEMLAAVEHAAKDDNSTAVRLREVWKDGRAEAGLLAALEDQRPSSDRSMPWTLEAMLAAFSGLSREVLRSHSDSIEDDDFHDGQVDFNVLLNIHLQDFTAREGHFARLMHGETSPQARHLLQAAFRRAGSWPNVLVVQSAVGREGLNLQDSCRAIVLLHLEWNPGHVEQQIGRIDRIGSRWRREAAEFLQGGGDDAPRIIIRPVLVRGTYADYQWSVLERRWENLRSQLNGDILPVTELSDQDKDIADLRKAVHDAAPNFSPTSKADAVPE